MSIGSLGTITPVANTTISQYWKNIVSSSDGNVVGASYFLDPSTYPNSGGYFVTSQNNYSTPIDYKSMRYYLSHGVSENGQYILQGGRL